jgi:hypothetical protein
VDKIFGLQPGGIGFAAIATAFARLFVPQSPSVPVARNIKPVGMLLDCAAPAGGLLGGRI